MSSQVPHPPKAPTEGLKLESFKTFSRLQLIQEFQPWLQYSIEYTRRRVNSSYYHLWDCLCFGAPLSTLLELIGSPTPRHLAVTADEFDFNLPLDDRQQYFSSFIHRVQSLEVQGQLPFGEVLKTNDFLDGQSSGFSRILRTVNRILQALDACYPGLFTVPHGSDIRRSSLVHQLIETEKAHVGKLAITADYCSLLYENRQASHVSLECFIISCSRLVPYHDQVLRGLLESLDQTGFEPWSYIFALQNPSFFTQMKISYHALCTNYISFQRALPEMKLDAHDTQHAHEILRNISSILSRFSEYQNILQAILNATAPDDQVSYDELCKMVHESVNLASALENAGLELKTMATERLLLPRLKTNKNLDLTNGFGTLMLDDCLIIDLSNGEHYSVFFFQTTILCCRDHRRSDNINLESARYPIHPWEMGPALLPKYPLQIVRSIPTSDLKTLKCIDDEYFTLIWGANEQYSLTFYPTIHPQYKQWTASLEPFVSRVIHSSSPKLAATQNVGAPSIYPESFLSLQGDKFSTLRRSSIARPWSLIGRKGNRSESSSFVNFDMNETASILSANMLPALFTGNLSKSPLSRLFAKNEPIQVSTPSTSSVFASTSEEPTFSESPTEETPPSIANHDLKTINGVADLTKRIVKDGHFPAAHGGYSDVWKGVWRKEDDSQLKIAVKVLRTTTNDQGLTRKLQKLEHEIEIWRRLSHPNVLPLLGLVCDFGPHPSMVCPWLNNGSMTKYLERCGDIITIEDRLRLVSEVAGGLSHLHSRSIVHGDLSGANVLIDDDYHAQICDFGMSVIVGETNCQSGDEEQDIHFGGSVRWADLVLFQSLDDDDRLPPLAPVNDISSLGSVIFEILSGRIPYHYIRSDPQVVIQLHQGIRPRRPAISFINESQWDLIQLCWDENVQNRPSAAEAFALCKGLFERHDKPATTHTLAESLMSNHTRKSA